MNKAELRQIIAEEVQKELRILVPKLVKPHIQEAVAGALSAILIEGVIAGPSKRTPVQRAQEYDDEVVPVARVPRDRASLAESMGYGDLSDLMPNVPVPSNMTRRVAQQQEEAAVSVAPGMPTMKLTAVQQALLETMNEARRGEWSLGNMGAGNMGAGN